MSESNSRPRALVAIVIYKCFETGLMTVVAIGLLLTSKNHDALLDFANEYMTIGKREMIKSGLLHVLNISTSKIQLGAIVAAIYAAVNGIEAIGLWQQQTWATFLVVGIVGATIPIEIYEIIHKASAIKFGVFALNFAMFVYLLRHAIAEHKKKSGSSSSQQ